MKTDKRQWYALYTKPRFEKKINSQLATKNIETFLPLQIHLKKWCDRKKKIEVPLFTSYVFIHTTEKERFLALQSPGVIKCVTFRNELAIIRDDEIENIKKLLSTGKILEVEPKIVIGAHVKVITGPLNGMYGILAEIRGRKRFAITIPEINSSISIEIPGDELEIISNERKYY